MPLYGENMYSVETNITLNNERLETLVLMYQPLIGAKATMLFLTLNTALIHTNYSNLSLISNLTIEEIEHSLILLEQYRLIKTYKKKEHTDYIHVLLEPLRCNEFINHYVYGLELKKVIGTHQFNVLLIKYKEKYLLKDDYVEITETKVFNKNHFDEEDLEKLIKNSNSEITINDKFNFDLFLSDASELKFPSKLRTTENLNLISELALFYGISELRMATLVYRSIDYKNGELVVDKLLDRVRREQVEYEHNINKYDLPTVAFLKSIQNGAAVSDYNKKLLEQLAFEMKLTRQVANRVIEYTMELNNNRLIHNFALQIATTWKAYDVKTVEDANDIIRKIDYSQKKNFIPDQSSNQVSRETVVNDKQFSDEESNKLQEQWKKLGEKYGDGKVR